MKRPSRQSLLTLAVLVAAWALLFALGCARPAAKITPPRSTIIEVSPPTPTPAASASAADHFADPGRMVSVGEFLVACALAAQPERPESRPESRNESRDESRDERVRVTRPDGTVIEAPPGSGLRFVETEGAGLSTTDPQAARSFSSRLPEAAAGSSSVGRGGMEFFAARLGAAPATAWYTVVGGILIAAGAAAFFFARWLTLPLVAAGAALIGVGWLIANAWWAFGLTLLVALALAVWMLLRARAAGDDAAAVKAIAQAVEQSEAAYQIKATVKDIAARSNVLPRVKRATSRAKAVKA